MNISGTLEKTPPVPRKKIGRIEQGGEHRWSAQDRAVAEKQKLYLDRRESLKADVGELEYHLLGPTSWMLTSCILHSMREENSNKGCSTPLARKEQATSW